MGYESRSRDFVEHAFVVHGRDSALRRAASVVGDDLRPPCVQYGWFGPRCRLGKRWGLIRTAFSIRLTRPRFRPFAVPATPALDLPSLGRTNYACCEGDSAVYSRDPYLNIDELSGDAAVRFPYKVDTGHANNSNSSQRGMFVNHREMRFRDVLDGLANTVMCGEIATDLGDNDSRTTVPLAA